LIEALPANDAGAVARRILSQSSPQAISSRRRWSMLGLSMAAQISTGLIVNGPAFLIPVLHNERHLSLAKAGLLVTAPNVGMMLTLIAWGAIVDRIGERLVLTVGLFLTSLAALAASMSHAYVTIGAFLLIGGMASASSNAASGRVVIGWFPAEQRGLAMGIRQMAQPLSVALAALTIPPIAASHGLGPALLLPFATAAAACLACGLLLIDPPRPSRRHVLSAARIVNPYRASSLLWRIHGVSVLLVIPQVAVWTYALVWLTNERGWSAAAAGLLVTATQILGALGRVAAGVWSDRVGSRMRPVRTIAIAAALVMAGLGLTDWLGSPLSVLFLVAASIISVADNGLAFTSVAEISGPFWSGRALGTQNTAQVVAGAAVPPLMGAFIGAFGYPAAFAATAICGVLAAPLVPMIDTSDAAAMGAAYSQPVAEASAA
jgi:MFS family permease